MSIRYMFFLQVSIITLLCSCNNVTSQSQSNPNIYILKETTSWHHNNYDVGCASYYRTRDENGKSRKCINLFINEEVDNEFIESRLMIYEGDTFTIGSDTYTLLKVKLGILKKILSFNKTGIGGEAYIKLIVE